MSSKTYSRSGRLALLAGLACLVISGSAIAQFSSGSNGEDGALNITSNTTLPVQPDGVHNYTTINVNISTILSFSPNETNTPVILLAQGDVTINGTINVSGQTGRGWSDVLSGTYGSEAQGGPGGYPGGIGGHPIFHGGTGIGTSGGGPGGGHASTNANPEGAIGRGGNGGSHFTAGAVHSSNEQPAAPTYGDPRLLTLSGGSGGAGSNMYITSASIADGAGGGGGGGGILIASSGTITINGQINANGGSAEGQVSIAGGGGYGAGGGAGGTIRLMANTINGSGSLVAQGGNGASTGGAGLIRLEAVSFGGNLLHNCVPPPSSGLPSVVQFNPADIPTIRITQIASTAVPQPPSGSTGTPDVILPSSTPNPVTITLATTNIPNGATIRVRILQGDGSITEVNSTAVNNGAATASANLVTGIGVVYAVADF